MRIQVNGQPREIEEGSNLDMLLRVLNLDRGTVVVELNRQILAIEDFSATGLQDKDQVEIIQFVGGG